VLPDGWKLWLKWEEACDAAGPRKHSSDAEFVRADAGRFLCFVRMVARTRSPG
jgi:hypothetical protein